MSPRIEIQSSFQLPDGLLTREYAATIPSDELTMRKNQFFYSFSFMSTVWMIQHQTHYLLKLDDSSDQSWRLLFTQPLPQLSMMMLSIPLLIIRQSPQVALFAGQYLPFPFSLEQLLVLDKSLHFPPCCLSFVGCSPKGTTSESDFLLYLTKMS